MADTVQFRTALIVGAGTGLGAALARRFRREGLNVAVAARSTAKLQALADDHKVLTIAADATRADDVANAFLAVERAFGEPDVVVYNASGRVRGPFVELDATAVAETLSITAFGGFLVAQEAARRMVPKEHGAILLTGASASVKGYAQSAPFAMGKFALRGLAQSIARELAPKGIHVAHFVIDGGIRSASRADPPDAPDSVLSPDAIAQSYWHVLNQDRSAWTWEIELRPWRERF